MRKLNEVFVAVPKLGIDGEMVGIYQWERGDPFPELGPSVGVDTETLLITEDRPVPPLVVLGVFDGASRTCYISYWDDAPEFMRQLNKRDIEQRYFNLGFDEQVLDNEDEERTLLTAIDQNRVFDMSIRSNIYDIATRGWIRYSTRSLAGASLKYLGLKLDKGDGTEESARLSFKRYNADGSRYVITEDQSAYLMFDCLSTWGLGEVIPVSPIDAKAGVRAPVECAHVKGMVVLAHISSNGFPVDMEVFEALERKIRKDMDDARNELITSYQFPDPYRDPEHEAEEVYALLDEQCRRLAYCAGYEYAEPRNDKFALKLAIMCVYEYENNVDDFNTMADQVTGVLHCDRKSPRKDEKALWDDLCEHHGIGPVDRTRKKLAMPAFTGMLLKSSIDQHDNEGKGTYDFETAKEAALAYLDEHPYWYSEEDEVKPKAFFQRKVKELQEQHEELKTLLDKTPKSGDVKLTLKDMWKLEDVGAGESAKFFDVYTRFKHCEKLLSTYLNREYICKSDHRVRAHYTNLVRTGRTSCSSPNLQNLPSRDKAYPIKNMYTAPPGAILCATDFSFVELVNLAQSCLDRFGHSVMADIINAHVDPHRWFAAVRDGQITSDTEFTKHPDKVEQMNALLKEVVTKEARQHSKAANFGLPGGMSAKRFYVSCREQGIKLTLDQCAELRDKWISTFTEMNEHMEPIEMTEADKQMTAYGKDDVYVQDDEEEENNQEESDKKEYVAVMVNGMKRNHCSYCSAMNLQFQGLAAYGVKLAMWKLAMAKGPDGNGYLSRMLCMIH